MPNPTRLVGCGQLASMQCHGLKAHHGLQPHHITTGWLAAARPALNVVAMATANRPACRCSMLTTSPTAKQTLCSNLRQPLKYLRTPNQLMQLQPQQQQPICKRGSVIVPHAVQVDLLLGGLAGFPGWAVAAVMLGGIVIGLSLARLASGYLRRQTDPYYTTLENAELRDKVRQQGWWWAMTKEGSSSGSRSHVWTSGSRCS